MKKEWILAEHTRLKYKKILEGKGINENNIKEYSTFPKSKLKQILSNKPEKIKMNNNNYQKLNSLARRIDDSVVYYEVDDYLIEIVKEFLEVYIKQSRVAERIGISQPVISSLINKRTRRINEKSYRAIIRAYDDFVKTGENKKIRLEQDRRTKERINAINEEERQSCIQRNKRNFKSLEVNKTYDLRLDFEDEIKHVKILEEFKNYYLGQVKNYRITILKNDLHKRQVKIKEIN